jgi:hypothetical protein
MKTGPVNFSVGSQFGNAWRDDYGLETKHNERMLTIVAAEFGKEKMIPLKGLDDVAIQKQISELVKTPI